MCTQIHLLTCTMVHVLYNTCICVWFCICGDVDYLLAWLCMCILAYYLLVCIELLCLHCSYKESCTCTLLAGTICDPAPGAPANGQQIGSGTTVGSIVTYTCNPGYTLQRDNNRTCMANGHWSGRAPICDRKLLRKHMFHYRYNYMDIKSCKHPSSNDDAVWWQLRIGLDSIGTELTSSKYIERQ